MLSKLFAVLLALAFASPAFAQELTLKVLAKGSGIPVSRVEIKIPGASGEKLYTDKAGQAKITVPAAGDGEIELYRHSYETLKIPIADLRGKAEFEAYVYPASPSDNEVLIRGAKRPETSRKTISVQEAAKVAPGGDPAQVPKLLPGVQSNSFQPDIIVRGSGPNDSRYLIDEWSVPIIFHSVGGISILPDQLLSDVEFSSGGFGAQYGNATGGVVALRTKNEVPEQPKLEFRVNVPIYSGLYYERPLDEKSFIAASARRSYIEKILPFVLKAAGAEDSLTVTPLFGDEHLYYFQGRDDGHLKVLGMHAYDGLRAVFDSEFSDDEDGRARFSILDRVCLIGAEYRKVLDKDWSVTVSPYVNDVQRKIDITQNRIHIGARSAVVVAELTRRLSKSERLFLGTELGYIRGTADVYAPQPDFSDPFFDFEEAPKIKTRVTRDYRNIAAWISLDQELGPVTLTPGVRAFHTTQMERSGADPRLAARFTIDANNTLKSAVGQYSQLPEPRDTNPDFGNPKLKFIRSNHYILGVETKWGDRWLTEFQTFYKRTFALVRTDPKTKTDNDGDLLAAGFEAFVRRNLTEQLFGWLSYTYSRNKERDSDQETYANSQYDQTHVLNLAGNYKLSAVWDFGGRLVYHTGDTYTKVDDAVYNANLDKYQPRTAPESRNFNGRLPSYHELDLYTSYDFLYDSWKLTARTGVEFIAVKQQAVGIQNNYDFSKEEYFENLPPIPYIELRGVL